MMTKILILLLCLFTTYGQFLNQKTKQNSPAEVKGKTLKEDKFLKKISPVVVAIQHENSTGSGFIISKDGYILTNGHVVHLPDKEEPLQPAKRITVTLWNEEKYVAKVIGFSLDPDVALIKIEPKTPLKVAEIGNSKIIKTGQVCYAFGSPYGINKTLTKGIISRSGLTDLRTFTKLFQIDAVINPGNSGGPLFDEKGNVIGINTYRSPDSGLGYSIPIHFAMYLKEHYLKYGRFIRSDIPYFFAKAMTQDFADYWNTPRGVLIDHVEKNTYAWSQGLREKDVIVEMNGKKVSGASEEDFYDWIWDITILPVGSEVKVVVMRQNEKGELKKITLPIILKESDPLPSYGYQYGEIPEISYSSFGFRVQEINPLLWLMRNLTRKKGVRVSFISKNSLAIESGLRTNAVIYEINGKKIENISDFKQVMDEELANQTPYLVFKSSIANDLLLSVLAPRYRIKDKQVLIISSKDNKYLPIYKKYLKMEGAKVTVNLDQQNLESKNWDAILLSDINADGKSFNQNILNVLEKVDKSRVVLAGDRKSPLYFLKIDNLKKLKITMEASLLNEDISKEANYTGKDIQKDKNLITTTAIDRKTARQYITQIINSIYKNSFH